MKKDEHRTGDHHCFLNTEALTRQYVVRVRDDDAMVRALYYRRDDDEWRGQFWFFPFPDDPSDEGISIGDDQISGEPSAKHVLGLARVFMASMTKQVIDAEFIAAAFIAAAEAAKRRQNPPNQN